MKIRGRRERGREKKTFVEIRHSLSPLIANGMDRKMITEWPDTGKNKREGERGEGVGGFAETRAG